MAPATRTSNPQKLASKRTISAVSVIASWKRAITRLLDRRRRRDHQMDLGRVEAQYEKLGSQTRSDECAPNDRRTLAIVGRGVYDGCFLLVRLSARARNAPTGPKRLGI